MSPDEGQALRARKRALRAELARRKAEARAELERQRQALGLAPARRDRRLAWVLLALLAVLLLLLSDCSCQPEPPQQAAPGPAAEEPEPELTPPVEAPKRPQAPGRIARLDRPEYRSEVPEVLPWVAAFQRQVEARSPRLAACFVGAERPGRMKWTAAVAPETGRVSEHSLEPTVADEVLSRVQRQCLIGVLSDPPYRFQVVEGRATPSRVSLVIEF